MERGLKGAWREIERVKQYGFTQEELVQAKENYMSRIESAWKGKEKKSSSAYVTEYVQYFLRGVAAPGIDKELELAKTFLPAISVADVNAITKKYIGPVDRNILILAPEKDMGRLPDEATVNAWLSAVALESLKPYTMAGTKLKLLNTDPVPGKIIDEKRDEKLNLNTLTLSNGMKVVLKPTVLLVKRSILTILQKEVHPFTQMEITNRPAGQRLWLKQAVWAI